MKTEKSAEIAIFTSSTEEGRNRCCLTWSPEPCKGLAVCRAKESSLSSFLSYFKTLGWVLVRPRESGIHDLPLCSQALYRERN